MTRRLLISIGSLLLASSLVEAQKNKEQIPVSGAVLQSETKLVVVDVVASDKKGNYVGNLEAKDFRVWEDNKEQTIKTFSSGTEVAPTRYLILFFEGLTLQAGDQARARQFATQFVEAVAGPARRMAVIDFDNNLRVAQDFTGSVERLTAAIKTVRMTPGAPMGATMAGQGMPRGGGRTNNAVGMPPAGAIGFGSRILILSLKTLAKNLNSVPGRKTMIWFSGGFQADNSELQAMLESFNRSNVAIFPVDMSTLGGLTPFASTRPPASRPSGFSFLSALLPRLGPVVSPAAFGFQQGGGTSNGGTTGGGGAAGGGATGGGATPGGGANPGGANPGAGAGGATAPTFGGGTNSPPSGDRRNSARPDDFGNIDRMNGRNPQLGVPQFDSSTSNRQILSTLADKTGGFVVPASSDTIAGLGRIGREQEAFYVLGYTPPPSEEGTCHSLKVKVNRGGVNLRSRNGYCNARPADLLAGNPIEKELETRAGPTQPGNLAATIQLPFFYTSENVARVNAAMEINLTNLKFEKQKGKPHAAVHVLGTAYTADGGVGARFSDTVNLDFNEQAEADRVKQQPYHYENQFEIAPGQYTLKLVFSSGRDSFGKLETPLVVAPYHPSQFAVSSLALSKDFKRAANLDLGAGISLLGDSIPLIVDGLEVIPSGTNQFPKKQIAGFYCEIYEPLLVTPDPNTPLAVGVQVRVFDRTTGEKKADSGLVRVAIPPKSESPVIRLGLKAPIEELDAGSYFLELTASDTNNKVAKRTAPFEIK